MNNVFFTVCGIVEIDRKVLLVRHTYGSAKNRILLPGGYVLENELAATAIEREIYEETGIQTKVESLIAMQNKPEQWCSVFVMKYISGTPISDGYENSEILLLDVDEAIQRADITNMSRQILISYKNNANSALKASNFIPKSYSSGAYALYIV